MIMTGDTRQRTEHRVVLTGLGVVSPIGLGVDEFWEGLQAGRNGVTRLTHFDPSRYRSQMAAEVKDFHPEDWIEKKSVGRMDRFIHFAMAAGTMAMQDSGLAEYPYDGNRAGVIIGSGIGGSLSIQEAYEDLQEIGPKSLSPFTVTKILINMAACQVSIKYGLKGPLSAPCVACSTSSNAIGDAFRTIQRGDADIMLAGGAEASLNPLPYGGFCAGRSMSTRNEDPEHASRPFDKNRDGFVMGEGSGVVVLEKLEHARSRGARIYAEVVGYGNTADAFHYTAPEPEGDGMVRVMQAALDDAGLESRDVGYVNAHGTSTLLNDRIESAAIRKVFGEHSRQLKVSSIKSMIGHLLAAAGAVELISTAKSIHTGILPPTINYEEPDPDCPLDYVTQGAEKIDLVVAVSNSFGFGGGNVCLVVKRFED
jgi:3-oxoacyl-[acyl-carrier-protein] synthase II